RDLLDAEILSGLDGLHDHEVVQPRLGGSVPAHKVKREAVASPRDEVQQRLQRSVLSGRRDHAPLVAGAANPAERHRESALGRRATPGVGLPGQPRELIGWHVTDPPDFRDVAGPANPRHHLPDVTHGTALQREVGNPYYRLVAELKRGQVAGSAPDLGAKLTAAEHRWHPGVPRGHIEELVDRPRPGFRIAERITAREHHP